LKLKREEELANKQKRDALAAEEAKQRAAAVTARAQEILTQARETAKSSIRLPVDKLSSSAAALSVPVRKTQANFLTKFKNLLSGNGFGKQSFKREDIAKLGLNVLLAYGFVSNVSYVTCIISAWVAHGKRTGLSPLVPGQWKSYLAIYVGLWAANNVLRPLRFSLSLVLSPSFEKFVAHIQRKTQVNRSAAIAAVVFLVNVCGTLSFLFGGLFLATSIARVPLLP
jgi:hypothetical protein